MADEEAEAERGTGSNFFLVSSPGVGVLNSVGKVPPRHVDRWGVSVVDFEVLSDLFSDWSCVMNVLLESEFT